MVLAPERPPRTQPPGQVGRRSWPSVILAVGLTAVCLGLVVWLTARHDDGSFGLVGAGTPPGPGPLEVVGPQDGIGPQDVDAVVGTGVIVTEKRAVSGFGTVVIAGEGDVVLVQSATPSVTVRTDENLLGAITTEVHGSTLYLDTAPGVREIDPTEGVRFEIALPTITGVAITGAGSISADGLTTERLSVLLSGVGTIELSGLEAMRLDADGFGAGTIVIAGQVESQIVTIGGAVTYLAADLDSRVADVDTDSVGEVVVRVRDRLDIALRGLGAVEYYGSPQVTSDVSGSGAVRVAGDG